MVSFYDASKIYSCRFFVYWSYKYILDLCYGCYDYCFFRILKFVYIEIIRNIIFKI